MNLDAGTTERILLIALATIAVAIVLPNLVFLLDELLPINVIDSLDPDSAVILLGTAVLCLGALIGITTALRHRD